jgi:DNA-binding phage protein
MTEEQNQQQIGDHDLADRTGISREAFKQWRSRRSPAIHNIEAALNVLGYQLAARRVRRD